MRIKLAIFVATFFLIHSQTGAVPRYGDDLAKRLLQPSEVRKATAIKAMLRRESKESETFFVIAPPPFDEIQASPNTSPSESPRLKSWSLPPWPSLDPPLSEDLSPEAREILEQRRNSPVIANVWAEVDVSLEDREKPSALLRPRRIPEHERMVIRPTEVPEPFSLRRYFDRPDVFVEIAAYGGTTSFKAEEAYRALKQASVGHEPLEGIGSEAFLARLIITEDPPPLEEMEEEEFPFDGVDLQGPSRPELADSGRAEALSAPAFQELAVVDLEGKRIRFPVAPKNYGSDQPKVLHSLLVLVAFFPDQGLTVSLAIEERLGTIQDLIALGLLTQRNIKERIAGANL